MVTRPRQNGEYPITDQLLDLLRQYGVVALVPVLFASAVGIPLPGSLLLVAAGAFATAGPPTLLPLLLGAIGATVAGNALGYWIGRRGGTAAVTRWGRRLHIGAGAIARADRFFARYCRYAVALSRFPLSPLSAVINIVAGTAGYSARAFLVANLAGVGVWATVYLGLGYAFARSWVGLAAILGGTSQALTIALVVGALLVVLLRALAHRPARVAAPPVPASEVPRAAGPRPAAPILPGRAPHGTPGPRQATDDLRP